MGFLNATPEERRRLEAEYELRAQARLKERDDARLRLARKIVMMVTDTVNSHVIRPGPVAEERECYDMAQEVHDLKPILEDLVVRILDVDNGENTSD